MRAEPESTGRRLGIHAGLQDPVAVRVHRVDVLVSLHPHPVPHVARVGERRVRDVRVSGHHLGELDLLAAVVERGEVALAGGVPVELEGGVPAPAVDVGVGLEHEVRAVGEARGVDPLRAAAGVPLLQSLPGGDRPVAAADRPAVEVAIAEVVEEHQRQGLSAHRAGSAAGVEVDVQPHVAHVVVEDEVEPLAVELVGLVVDVERVGVDEIPRVGRLGPVAGAPVPLPHQVLARPHLQELLGAGPVGAHGGYGLVFSVRVDPEAHGAPGESRGGPGVAGGLEIAGHATRADHDLLGGIALLEGQTSIDGGDHHEVVGTQIQAAERELAVGAVGDLPGLDQDGRVALGRPHAVVGSAGRVPVPDLVPAKIAVGGRLPAQLRVGVAHQPRERLRGLGSARRAGRGRADGVLQGRSDVTLVAAHVEGGHVHVVGLADPEPRDPRVLVVRAGGVDPDRVGVGAGDRVVVHVVVVDVREQQIGAVDPLHGPTPGHADLPGLVAEIAVHPLGMRGHRGIDRGSLAARGSLVAAGLGGDPVVERAAVPQVLVDEGRGAGTGLAQMTPLLEREARVGAPVHVVGDRRGDGAALGELGHRRPGQRGGGVRDHHLQIQHLPGLEPRGEIDALGVGEALHAGAADTGHREVPGLSAGELVDRPLVQRPGQAGVEVQVVGVGAHEQVEVADVVELELGAVGVVGGRTPAQRDRLAVGHAGLARDRRVRPAARRGQREVSRIDRGGQVDRVVVAGLKWLGTGPAHLHPDLADLLGLIDRGGKLHAVAVEVPQLESRIADAVRLRVVQEDRAGGVPHGLHEDAIVGIRRVGVAVGGQEVADLLGARIGEDVGHEDDRIRPRVEDGRLSGILAVGDVAEVLGHRLQPHARILLRLDPGPLIGDRSGRYLENLEHGQAHHAHDQQRDQGLHEGETALTGGVPHVGLPIDAGRASARSAPPGSPRCPGGRCESGSWRGRLPWRSFPAARRSESSRRWRPYPPTSPRRWAHGWCPRRRTPTRRRSGVPGTRRRRRERT